MVDAQLGFKCTTNDGEMGEVSLETTIIENSVRATITPTYYTSTILHFVSTILVIPLTISS